MRSPQRPVSTGAGDGAGAGVGADSAVWPARCSLAFLAAFLLAAFLIEKTPGEDFVAKMPISRPRRKPAGGC